MRYAEKLILAKIEATEGTDSLPVLASDLVRTIGAEITPLTADASALDIDQPYGGNSPQRLRRKRTGFTLPFLGTPSGTAGTKPEGAALFRACGLGETVTEDTSVIYAPVRTGFETASLYFNQSGLVHKATGVKGNLTLEVTQGEDPLFTVTGEGGFAAPEAMDLGTADFSGFQGPLEVNEANTTLTIGGPGDLLEFDLETLSFDCGLPQTFISRTLQTGIKTGDAAPSGSLTVTHPALTKRNFIEQVGREATAAVRLVHGTAAGHIMTLDLPRVQLLEPSYSESEGDLMIGMTLNPLPGADGLAWKLTYT